ncbi:MAG: 50S ribosomal protein L31e [Nanobdellota archaeon]
MRTYNIPLRRDFLKTPGYKRSKRAVSAVKEFLKKHMKTENVNLSNSINLRIWENGIRNPPHHIKVNTKTVEGVTYAVLEGENFPVEEEKKKSKKKDTKEDKGKKEEEKSEQKSEDLEKKTTESEENKPADDSKESGEKKTENKAAEKQAKKQENSQKSGSE